MVNLNFGELVWVQDEEVEDCIFNMLSWASSRKLTNLLVCKTSKGTKKYVNIHNISEDLLKEAAEGFLVFIGSLRQLSQILDGKFQEEHHSISVVFIDSGNIQAAEYDWDAGLYLGSGTTVDFIKRAKEWLNKEQSFKDF